MPALSRMSAAALTVALAATAAVTVDGVGVASTQAARTVATTTATTTHADDGTLRLGSDAVLPNRAGRVAKVQRWKVRTLYYYDGLPTKWDWSLATAVGKWNSSGGGIKLARTTVVSKAHVRIGYGNIGSAAGMATVGATPHAYVKLSSRYTGTDAVNARNRVTIMNVLAHELGHVLGFQHTTTRCSLMSPVIDVDACNVVPATQPGYYKCRTIDTALVQRFVKLYGGRATYPSATWCPIDPLPKALTGVTFTGGTSGPVTLHWNGPTSVPAGSTLVVKRWTTSTCGTAPASANTFRPSMAAGVWQDQVTYQAEVACFQVQLLNRYGAGPAAQKRALSRWVPKVASPVVGTPTYDFDAEQFTFTATVPAGTTLRAAWDTAHPTTCVTSPSGGTNLSFVPVVDGHGSLAAPPALPQCVSFFAHDAETNRFSSAVPITFAIPVPQVGAVTWDASTHAFRAAARYPAGTRLVYRTDVNPTVCPGAYTAGGQSVVEDEDRLGPGVVEFQTASPDQCVAFYAVDDVTGSASAPRSVVVHAALPTGTPSMGPITMLEQNAYPWLQAEFTGLAAGDHIGYAVVAGGCPQTAPAVAHWRTQLQNSITDPPEKADYGLFPSVVPDLNCVLFTSLDWYGWSGAQGGNGGTQFTERHGPVSMQEFVDEGPVPPTVGTPVWNAATETFEVPVSQTTDLRVVYDPTNPGTCPAPGTSRIQPVQIQAGSDSDHVFVTPPAPSVCATFYIDAGVGPAPLSFGVPVDLTVPSNG